MAGIKVIQPNCGQDVFEAFSEICPFGAFSYENDTLEVTAACKMCKMCLKKGPEGILEFEADEAPKVDKDAYKGITVYVDHVEGQVHPVTLELIGKAKELAAVIHHPVYALFIGSGIEKQAMELLHYGVDKVFVYDDVRLKNFAIEPYANAFSDFIEKEKPSSILVGATNVGRSLAPRVAARFRTGLTADCTVLEMKENTDLVQIRPAFGGNIMAQIVTENNRPQFATVRYKIFNAPVRSTSASGDIIPMTMEDDNYQSSIDVLEVIQKEKGIDISEADVIVAVGRGLKSDKDLPMIQEFADAIGAELACTRPCIEAGWFDARRQIGLSGRTVKPQIIIALGISGSVQFAAGMQNSDFIIAVNSDPKASIFNIAHAGIVGDLYEILPELMTMIDSNCAESEAV
ncbi:lactate dehydrogenase subunit LctC [Eubacterium sp.]|uniref:lactate dehydrogenase subunit LctC n=1 Tax=Eubacterium sp. TaxID=142586 RepID=UPI002FC76E50